MEADIRLLRRAAEKLNPGALRTRLEGVIAGLATPAFFSASEGQILSRQTHIEEGRRELRRLLPELRAALRFDADVKALGD